jgi:hypothetical protein
MRSVRCGGVLGPGVGKDASTSFKQETEVVIHVDVSNMYG